MNQEDNKGMALLQDIKEQLSNKTSGDKGIWTLAILLACISVLVVYSSTGSLAYKINKGHNEIYLFKQIGFLGIGLLLMYGMHRLNYTIYKTIATFLYYASIVALIYTLLFGAKINEGSRWIKLPVIHLTIQTSDIARLALFIFISKLLSKKQDCIKDFKKGFLPIFGAVIGICAFIAPANLSTALLTGLTSLLIMFIGRISGKHLSLVVLTGIFCLGILLAFAAITYNGKHKDNDADSNTYSVTEKVAGWGRVGTWIKRVQDFVFAKNEETPYQVQQAKIAIANGSIFTGLGPGNSRQRNFLPHPYSDFIYAIIIEEYGLLGGFCVMGIYLIFLYRCIKIFKRCPYAFGAFLALSLSFTLVIQALANMAVNVNLVPVTGVTLPLISMGGSSFIFNCISIGIILSVARNVEEIEGKQVVPITPNNAANI